MKRLSLSLAAVALTGCAAYNSPVPPSVSRDLQGRRIIVQAGCPERTNVHSSAAEDYANDFPGRYHDDGVLDTMAAHELLAGFTKGLTDPRIVVDSSACPNGAGAQAFPIAESKDTAFFSAGGIDSGAVYLARGPVVFSDQTVTYNNYVQGAGSVENKRRAIGASMGYALIDPRAGKVLHQGFARGKSGTDFLVFSFLSRRDWEAASLRVGSSLQKQLLQALNGR